MAKRSVTDEVQIAALSAAVELIKNPEYSRDWLKTEFADREINSVRVTNDILDAVEVTMVNQLDQIAAMLKLQLEALIERADAEDDYESPATKLAKDILDHDQDPDDTLQLESAEVTFTDAQLEVIKNLDAIKAEELAKGNEVSTSEAMDILHNRLFDHFHAKSRLFVTRAIEVVMDEERSKGNEVSEAEASAILQKRFTVGLE